MVEIHRKMEKSTQNNNHKEEEEGSAHMINTERTKKTKKTFHQNENKSEESTGEGVRGGEEGREVSENISYSKTKTTSERNKNQIESNQINLIQVKEELPVTYFVFYYHHHPPFPRREES